MPLYSVCCMLSVYSSLAMTTKVNWCSIVCLFSFFWSAAIVFSQREECALGSVEMVHEGATTHQKDDRLLANGDQEYSGLRCRLSQRNANGKRGAPIMRPRFYKNGAVLQTGWRVAVSGGVLTFSPFLSRDQGFYQCSCGQYKNPQSNGIILYVQPSRIASSFIVPRGDSVTFGCPLSFIQFMSIPLLYTVVWENYNGTEVVSNNTALMPDVSFDRLTLGLTILNVTEEDRYTCKITGFNGMLFHNSYRSHPVNIFLLGSQMVSVIISPSTVLAGGVINISCRLNKPYDNAKYIMQLSREGSTIQQFEGSTMNYLVGNTSLSVTCTVILYNLKAIPSTLVYNATETVIVMGTPKLTTDESTFVDRSQCIQEVKVDNMSLPKISGAEVLIIYAATDDPSVKCPASVGHGMVNATAIEVRHFHIDITKLPFDGTSRSIYVRAWTRCNGVNSACSNVVKLKTASGTCYRNHVIALSVGFSIVNAIMIVVLVICVCANCLIYRRHQIINDTLERQKKSSHSSRLQNLTVYKEKDVKRLEKIGRGSFWKVYDGRLSGNRCAVKRLRGVVGGYMQRPVAGKVLRELDTWSSLNHLNIVRLYGIYYEEGDADIKLPSLILERMDRSLTDHLICTSDPTTRKTLFPFTAKLPVLSQVLEGLDYLHTHKKIIHGDLTANNILVKENLPGSFTVKITDFGMSRALDKRVLVMSTSHGTHNYMPPEVHNAGQLTEKLDMYSFGVLCVHILSHAFPQPLYALKLDSLENHIVVSEFARYQHCLLHLKDDERVLEPVIEICLQYKPDDRPGPRDVISCLEGIMEGISTSKTDSEYDHDSKEATVIHQHFSTLVSGNRISGCIVNLAAQADIDTLPASPMEDNLGLCSGPERPETIGDCSLSSSAEELCTFV